MTRSVVLAHLLWILAHCEYHKIYPTGLRYSWLLIAGGQSFVSVTAMTFPLSLLIVVPSFSSCYSSSVRDPFEVFFLQRESSVPL